MNEHWILTTHIKLCHKWPHTHIHTHTLNNKHNHVSSKDLSDVVMFYWTNCSKLGLALELSILSCSSEHNDILHVLLRTAMIIILLLLSVNKFLTTRDETTSFVIKKILDLFVFGLSQNILELIQMDWWKQTLLWIISRTELTLHIFIV